MKRLGSKTASLIKRCELARQSFKEDAAKCAYCGNDRDGLDVHEICGGSNRQRFYPERCGWLLLCRRCHDIWQGAALAKQLALKAISDPRYYDRVRVLALYGNGKRTLPESEVQEFKPIVALEIKAANDRRKLCFRKSI